MIYVLYFILSAILILLVQEAAVRGGTACWEWEDAEIKDSRKNTSRKKKKSRQAEMIKFVPLGFSHNSDAIPAQYREMKVI